MGTMSRDRRPLKDSGEGVAWRRGVLGRRASVSAVGERRGCLIWTERRPLSCGAYSIDKMVRLIYGYGWWSDEQSSDEVKRYVEGRLDRLG